MFINFQEVFLVEFCDPWASCLLSRSYTQLQKGHNPKTRVMRKTKIGL